MNIRNFVNSRWATVLSALAVVAVALLTHPSGTLVQWYYCLAFWTLAGVDFYRSQVLEGGASEVNYRRQYTYADRFIGYLFAAPFIFPARVLRLATARASRR